MSSPSTSLLNSVTGGCFCPDWLHLKLDRHGASTLELQRPFDRFALDERLLQSDEHQVIAARGKSDGLTGPNLDPTFNRAHLDCATIVGRHMDLDPSSPGGGAPQEMIRRGTHAGNGEAASGLSTSL